MFSGADDIVLRKGVDSYGRDITVQRHVVRRAARVTGLIVHRRR